MNHTFLTGAHDIILVEHPDGTIKSSPWNIRFGSIGLIHHSGKVISVKINDKPAPFLMFVDPEGRGSFFATQGISPASANEVIQFPAKAADTVDIEPDDVRSFLRRNEETEFNTKRLDVSLILRDSAVDLEAALDFEDADPRPVSTSSSAFDLVQSMHSMKRRNTVDLFNPLPSALVLHAIRPLLRENENLITFAVSSLIQGPKVARASLFLWKSTDKIVVSDIDGTVTSSDMLGHILTTFGKDWTHPGLVKLYQKIARQGIKFVYLSSRPIGEAELTRKVLAHVDQGGIGLPSGALITAPDLVLTAMTRELTKRPHEFKIPTLQSISSLFGTGTNPFVLGFGNRPTDILSYKGIGLTDNQMMLFNAKHQVLDSSENVIFESIEALEPLIDSILSGKTPLIGT